MKIEAEKMGERVATEELVRELVRNDARRGEFMIMSDDADDSRFVQIACDYDEVGGKSDGLFDLEYRDGKNGYLYHCSRRVSTDEVERVFLDELAGRGEWRSCFDWELERGGTSGWTFSPTAGMPPAEKVLCYVAAAIAIAIGVPLISLNLYDAIKTALRPNADKGDWIYAGFFALFACVFIGGPVMQLVKWLKTRGKTREAHERSIPMDGIRLRRMLPNGLVFMAIWCIGWDAGAFYGLAPKFVDAVRAYSEKGFDAILVIGVVFPLIGVAMTVYFFRLLWKHLRPSYEVRLVGGLLKEGERATFEYRFKGDAEEVKSVALATAACAACEARHGIVGAQPGDINDEKKFTHSLEIASGSVTLEMPRIAKDCHTAFRYYFRATVVFKSGLVVSSSYRIPLK
ncbi:MAG: hypothetical protein IKP97_00030 [Kiritimatiellae bacterium]|nr:hypothetical protein [Kiritimatiellia bacterium]